MYSETLPYEVPNHWYFKLLTILIFFSSFAATAQSLYEKKQLSHGVTVDVPSHWVTLSESKALNIRAAAEALLGDSEGDKDSKKNLLLMNSSKVNHECQFRVSVLNYPVVSSEEVVSLSQNDLKEYTGEMKRIYDDMMKTQSRIKVTSVENAYKRLINDRWYLVLPYNRESVTKGDPMSWFVEVHQSSTKDSNYIITTSYRKSGDIACEIILDKVINSLNIDK